MTGKYDQFAIIFTVTVFYLLQYASVYTTSTIIVCATIGITICISIFVFLISGRIKKCITFIIDTY